MQLNYLLARYTAELLLARYTAELLLARYTAIIRGVTKSKI